MKSDTRFRRLAYGLGTLALFALALIVAGCGDDSLSGDGNYQIQYITSTPTSEVDRGATAVVEAQVTNTDGSPVSGVAVTFSVSPSALGYFTPAVDTSDADGIVAAIFTATSSGNATLTAAAGNAEMDKTLRINDSSVSTGRVTITLNPVLLTANGEDSAQVTISAETPTGDPVADGTTIYVAAGERFLDRNKDGYFTENVDSIIFDANANTSWDPIGNISSTVQTTGGQASVIYYAGNQATTVYIRATIDPGGPNYSYTEISAKLNPNTTVASITLTHQWEDLRVRGVGGIEFSVVTATAYDEFGNKVPEGIPISFTIANGPGGGENLQNQGYGPVEILTNQSGQAQVTVNSGTISGTIRLRAASGSILSAVTHLTVNAGPPAHMSIGADFCNQRSWDYVNVENKVSVNVSDIWGNPVPDSTAVWFSTEEGFVQAQALTGTAWPPGIAEVSWFSGNPRNDGVVFVWATTAGGTVGDTVAFLSSGPTAFVQVLQYPSSLIADGEDKGQVIVRGRDINSNWVVSNTEIKFDTDFGTLNGGTLQDGCVDAIFEGDFTSEILDVDYSPVSPDDGIGAIALVGIRVGGVVGPSASFTTLFLTGNTFTGNCEINIESEIEPGSTVPFFIVVKDRSGNPLGGHDLDISASLGLLSQTSAITNAYGEVNLFFTAPASLGASIITVTDTDPRGGVSFAKKVKIKNEE